MKFRIERDKTTYDLIEEVEADNAKHALDTAKFMFANGYEGDILYDDQDPDVDYVVTDLNYL